MAPVSAVAVSVGGMLGVSVGGGVGLPRVAGSIVAFVDNTKFILKLLFADLPCQPELIIQSSQPLFQSAPGPKGFARMAVETFPRRCLTGLQVALSGLGPTPWPCIKQIPPTTHLFFTAALSWLMRR